AATVYRREALQAVGGYRTELGHWMDTFVARAIGLRHGVCYVPRPFMEWRYSERGFCGSSRWDELLRVVRRAAALMRSPPFCHWFPAAHVDRWEPEALDTLFRNRVTNAWPLLRDWSDGAGWGRRFVR